MRFKIDVEVWPHSTSAGQAKDQEAAGGPRQTYEAKAGDFDLAVRFAHAFAAGIESHPAVWQARVVAVMAIGE